MSLFKKNESDPKKMFYILVIAFVAVELISWVLSQFDFGIPLLKGGFIIILLGLAILLTTLFTFGISIMQVRAKEIVLMVLTLAILVLLYVFLPQIVPQLFSAIPGNEINTQLRSFFTSTLGSVLGVGSGVV